MLSDARAKSTTEDTIMNDLSLRQTILDELEFQPDIDAANIGVAVDKGVVTLSGHVRTYAQKIAAEQAVKRIKGVRALAEEIQVRLAPGEGTADDTIATRALKIIAWSSDVPIDTIKVIVQKGWVTLEGKVDWQYQKETVERAVRKLSGVVGVDNRLTLYPRWKWPISSTASKKPSSAMPKWMPRVFTSR
jgi:osmotically-inducible protein OsmY